MRLGGPSQPPAATAGVIALLAGVGALGSMAIHMIVPVLPVIALDTGADAGAAQLTVSLYLVGLGAGQLVAGPVADRFGRRPVLLAGIVVFALAAIAAAAAGNATALLAARVVQALGAAACLVAVRAVVSDIAPRGDTAGQLAILTTVLLVSPAIAPLAGGAVAGAAGWRTIFLVLASLAVGAAFACHAAIGESLPRASRTARVSPLAGWMKLAGNVRFLRYAGAIACASTAMYIFLSGSGFLLAHEYGLAPGQAGVCYFLIAATGIAGSFAVRPLEARGGAFRVGAFAVAMGGATLLGCALLDFGGLAGLVGPISPRASATHGAPSRRCGGSRRCRMWSCAGPTISLKA